MIYPPFGGKGKDMAFINEKLTNEQKEEFNSWGIMQPYFGFGRIIDETPMRNPWYWTVDKERKMYLLDTTYDREYINECVFIFIWNGKDYRVQFYCRTEANNTVIWELPKKYLIDTVFPYCEEEHFLDDLREALRVYGYTGRPNENCNIKIMF